MAKNKVKKKSTPTPTFRYSYRQPIPMKPVYTQTPPLLDNDQEKEDYKFLTEILSYKRKADSDSEAEFIKNHLDTVEGMQKDAYGNRYIILPNSDGSASNVMFSCHTDSVHKSDGMQKVLHRTDTNGVGLLYKDDNECLGADNGAGIFVLLKLIEAKIGGLYVFHREEEIGGYGSSFFSEAYEDILEQYDYCIAFDRKGTNSIITEQFGGPCCSDEFATSLSDALGMDHIIDPTGSFTDSANYTHLIAECTNVSIGYENCHTGAETLNYRHLFELVSNLIKVDFSSLAIVRKPVVDDFYDLYSGYYNRSRHKGTQFNYKNPSVTYDDFYDLTWRDPDLCAYMLSDMGFTYADIEDYRRDMNSYSNDGLENDYTQLTMLHSGTY